MLKVIISVSPQASSQRRDSCNVAESSNGIENILGLEEPVRAKL